MTEKITKAEDKNPIQVAGRLFAVLEALADSKPMGLMELSTQMNLNKSTVHRILTSLSYMGYVKQDSDTGKYSLTLKILDLSNKLLCNVDILETIRPYLKELSESSGETVHFVQREGVEAVYIFKQESYQNSVRMVSRVGSHIPLYCSGVGKAIIAALTPTEIREIWKQSRIHKLTEHTITDFDTFFKALQEVQKNGYALDNEENELGVRCIAVSVPDYRGNMRYAISISAPTSRMTDKRIQELSVLMKQAKQNIIKSY